MSITWLSSKRFTQKGMYIFTLYRTSVIILTPLLLHPHIHSTVKLCRKGVLQTKREAFFEKMYFQIFLERGERWKAADVCRKRVPDDAGNLIGLLLQAVFRNRILFCCPTIVVPVQVSFYPPYVRLHLATSHNLQHNTACKWCCFNWPVAIESAYKSVVHSLLHSLVC